MRTTVENIYLSLLQTALWGGEMPEIPVDIDWEGLLQLTRIHGTGPLVYDQLLKLDGLMAPPADLATVMRQICMQNMVLQQQWQSLIRVVWDALEGLNPVLLKGFSYAQMYPLPHLRSWGDLDVWVGPENYHEACGRLRAAFPEAKHHDEEWDELKHYCFVLPDGKSIELHRVTMAFASRRDQRYYQRLESKAMVEGHMDPNFGLLFCFLHSWEHFCGTGIPHKQLCDLALLAHQGADAQYLKQHLKRLSLLEVWQSMGYVVCKTTGLLEREWPLYSAKSCIRTHGEALYHRIMEEGQARQKHYQGDSSNRYEAREKAMQMSVWKRKLLTLRGRIEEAEMLRPYAPKYARHLLWAMVWKGIRRTIKREEMILY